MRILGRDVSITGVSTPLAGAGWRISKSNREVLRELIVFLEDRRVLYAPLPAEVHEHVVDSIIAIRRELTRVLRRLSDDSPLAPTLRALRTECGNFLTRHAQPGYSFPMEFEVGLGELRGVFHFLLRDLTSAYSVPVHEELGKVLQDEPDRPDEEYVNVPPRVRYAPPPPDLPFTRPRKRVQRRPSRGKSP